MNRIIPVFIFLISSTFASAQINYGGTPIGWNDLAVTPSPEIFAKPDLKALAEEDAINDNVKNIPFRFGANMAADLDLNHDGNWQEAMDGTRIWRLAIDAPGAQSINFVFDQFFIPEGAKVFVYAADKSQLLGSFNSKNANPENSLGVGFIFSDRLIIQYEEPQAVAGQGYVHINNVTYGYRSVKDRASTLAKAGPFGNSAACNVNINCPEGQPYDIQKRSVAVIVVGNNGFCSGALVNNNLQDETPYFLTANHCLISDVGNWVFYFKHSSPNCDGSGTAPTNFSLSGAVLRASNAESDFGLLELNSDIPDSYGLCFAGYDASDLESGVINAFGIHHPSGDVAKLSREDGIPYHAEENSFVNQVWFIDNWEVGTTQGGSSGSPLFNQSGNIIGQLAGGTAGCVGSQSNGLSDFYGRFGVSWNFGNSSSSRLRDWLDPNNSGILIVPNSCNANANANDLTLGAFQNLEMSYCSLQSVEPAINVLNTGSEGITSFTLEISLNDFLVQTFNYTGSLGSFQSETVALNSINLEPGENSIKAEVTSVNGGADQNDVGNQKIFEINAFESSTNAVVDINFDDWGSETSWTLTTDEGTMVYSGSGYTNDSPDLEQPICLGAGCYTFTINDSEGDGLCCQFGQGSYQLRNVNGTIYASGASFNSTESTNFCITSTGVTENPTPSFTLYPNPTDGVVEIRWGELDGRVCQLRLSDATGRLIFERKMTTTDIERLNLNGLQSGLYFLTVVTSQEEITKRLVLTAQ